MFLFVWLPRDVKKSNQWIQTKYVLGGDAKTEFRKTEEVLQIAGFL